MSTTAEDDRLRPEIPVSGGPGTPELRRRRRPGGRMVALLVVLLLVIGGVAIW